MNKSAKIHKDGPCVIHIKRLGTEPGCSLGYAKWRAHTPHGLICQVINEMVDVYAHLFKENAEECNTDPKTYLRANVTAYLLRTFAKPESVLEMAQQIDKPMMDLVFGNIPIPEEATAK